MKSAAIYMRKWSMRQRAVLRLLAFGPFYRALRPSRLYAVATAEVRVGGFQQAAAQHHQRIDVKVRLIAEFLEKRGFFLLQRSPLSLPFDHRLIVIFWDVDGCLELLLARIQLRHHSLPIQLGSGWGSARIRRSSFGQLGIHSDSIKRSARSNRCTVAAWSWSPTAFSALPANARANVPSMTMPSLKQASTVYQVMWDRSRVVLAA